MHGHKRVIYRIEARTDTPARARRIVTSELAPLVASEKLDELSLLERLTTRWGLTRVCATMRVWFETPAA